MEYDNIKFKVVMMENVVLLEINIVEEKNVEINLEFKENIFLVVILID